jgi:nucleoside-diphosphate-sugar epimerase
MEKPLSLCILQKNTSKTSIQTMANILMVGCGDLGTAIAEHLHSAHQVIGARLSDKALPNNMQTIQADVTNLASLHVLENLKPNILIYCVSAGGATDVQYQAAYVTGLKNVLETQRNNAQLQHVFFVSSTRVYGQVTPELLDENTPAIPADFGGERLLEAENLLKRLPCNSTTMRLSGIYGEGRLYLVNMAKDSSKWPQDNHWSNRIHRDDAAAFIALLVDKSAKNQALADCYIVTDNQPTQQYEVLTWLARQQGIDTSHIKAPATQGGKRLSNQRMRDTGYELQYPDYQVGYTQILQQLKKS